MKFQVGSEKVKSARKTLKMPACVGLEEAVYKWYEQEQSKYVNFAWGGNSIGSRAFGEGSENYIINQQDATLTVLCLLTTAGTLYVFRTPFASITRSTINCNSSHWCLS